MRLKKKLINFKMKLKIQKLVVRKRYRWLLNLLISLKRSINSCNKTGEKQDPMKELENLENNEILNELLDALDAGKAISKADQQFVDECLDRISELMEELGIEDEDESEDDLYRTFERIDINQFR